MATSARHLLYMFATACGGASLLCIFATLQKRVIGAPLVLHGYIVPLLFGGIAGAVGGLYLSLSRKYSRLLKARVNTLLSLLPICSACKKIRKPDADYRVQDSWVPVEEYISLRTTSRFSHSICPACAKGLYGIDLLDGG